MSTNDDSSVWLADAEAKIEFALQHAKADEGHQVTNWILVAEIIDLDSGRQLVASVSSDSATYAMSFGMLRCATLQVEEGFLAP